MLKECLGNFREGESECNGYISARVDDNGRAGGGGGGGADW